MSDVDALLAKPYEDRQLIVISDEAPINPQVARPEGRGALHAFGDALLYGVVGGPALLVTRALVEWVESRSRRAQDLGVHVEAVRRADVQGLLFPPGHPRRKIVYVGHPFLKQQYVPLASFHKVLFEQKVIEAMELLAALGATSLAVSQAVGTESSAKLAASVGVPVQGAAVNVGIDGGRRQADQGSVLISATFLPRRPPYQPDGLIWYPHEEFWKSMTKLRLNNGLDTYRLEVNYEEDFGVNAQVSAKIQGVGLELGGEFKTLTSTKWVMSGTFAPMDLAT